MAVAELEAPTAVPVHTQLRALEPDDYDKGLLDLLAQLTVVGNVTKDQFIDRLKERDSRGDYHTVVIEDCDKSRVIGTATMLVELKLIRGLGKVAHVEDVVVDSTYRGLRLGQRLIAALVEHAKELQCYKIILDCSEENVAFYQKCGLTRKEVQMVGLAR